MLTLLHAALLLGTQASQSSIHEYIQDNLRDVTIVARVVKSDQAELKKINKDYAKNYAIADSTLRYKEPFKLRIDSQVEDTTISAVYNGAFLKISAPSIRVSSKQDLSDSTARRETAMDIGLLTPCLFPGFFNARFIRHDRETGCPVFDLTYVDKTESARFRIWVDPVRHILVKREWYNRYGTQLATFFYERPRQIQGVWLATMITVKNVDNRVAGVTQYESIKVNSGLSDSIFAVGR